MAIDIQVEGTSYIASSQRLQWMTDMNSVQVELDIAAQQPRASFDIVIWNQAITRPKAGQEAVFYSDVGAGTREFGGIIQQVKETELAPTIMKYECTCSDYTKWFDRHLVFGTFEEQDADELIATIVSQFVNTTGNTRTFTTNGVQASYPVPLQQFVYIAPSQVMAQLTQMLGWGWYIDPYRDVHFYSTQTNLSPLPGNLLDADDLYDNPALASSNYANWVNLDIGEDTSQIKDRCYVTGIYIASTQEYQEEFIADGVTQVFVLGYQPPNDVSKITVDVGGTYYQIGLDLIDAAPGSGEPDVAYVNFTQQTVRFQTAPAANTDIVVTYYPMLQTAVMKEDQAAEAFMAARDGTDGIYEYNRLDPSLSAELPTLALQRCQMTLNKYAYPYLTLKFTSFLQGWYPGQWFYFSSARRFDGEMNSANGTQRPFYVLSVSKKIIQAISGVWTWQYDISAASIAFAI